MCADGSVRLWTDSAVSEVTHPPQPTHLGFLFADLDVSSQLFPAPCFLFPASSCGGVQKDRMSRQEIQPSVKKEWSVVQNKNP